ncbi:hypothetical protein [Nonomuraea insulae]|uniref:Uncharacterized protein n=1 Tax=Nonomuraea insulae TaxID=1616787 RepID=A0ABW1DAU0_9ACTN
MGWMSQALALFTLNVYGMTTGDRDAYVMAELLDENVLVHLANGSLFTGFMLSALTRWGYVQYWWVLVKAVISLVQLNVAIFVPSPAPPAWFPYFVLAVPVADFALAFLVFGHPAPLFFLLTAVGYPFWRSRRLALAPARA